MKFDFTPEKIMLLLSNERLRIFEEAWKNPEREDDSLSCVAFTQLVLDTLMEDLNDDDEKYEVAYGCLKLFAEVDINNDGGMDWGEFMQYIIDAVSGSNIKEDEALKKKMRDKKEIELHNKLHHHHHDEHKKAEDDDFANMIEENKVPHNKKEEIDPEAEKLTVKFQIEQLRASKFLRFQINSKVQDKKRHDQQIQGMVHCNLFKKNPQHPSSVMLAFEKYSDDILIYDTQLELLGKQSIDPENENTTKSFITSVAYDNASFQIVVATSEGKLTVFTQNKTRNLFGKRGKKSKKKDQIGNPIAYEPRLVGKEHKYRGQQEHLDKHRKEFFYSTIEELKQNKANQTQQKRQDEYQLQADEQVRIQKENFEGFSYIQGQHANQHSLVRKNILDLPQEPLSDEESDEDEDEKSFATGPPTCPQFEKMQTIRLNCMQTRVFYMQKQQVWLTAGTDNILRHINISSSLVNEKSKSQKERQEELYEDCVIQEVRDHETKLPVHSDEITDCVEITNPLCIASCSKDMTIVIYDLERRQVLRYIPKADERGKDIHHLKPIMHLRYQTLNGAHMVSIGNETHANVWAPESVVSKIHLGKFKGKAAIIDGHFLNRAPYFATVDEANIINLWDLKSFTCIQSIPGQFAQQIEGLLSLSNRNFCIFGRKIIQYHVPDDVGVTDELNGDAKNEEQNQPIFACINRYLFGMFVVKKQEIRVYDLDGGQMVNIHDNVFEEEEQQVAEITKFCIDNPNRKAYVANNLGQIIVINCQSGVIIRNVTDDDEVEQDEGSEVSSQNDDVDKVLGDDENAPGDAIYGQNLRKLIGVTKIMKQKKQEDREMKRNHGGHKSVACDSESDKDDKLEKIRFEEQKRFANPEINDMHLIWEDLPNQKETMQMMVCSTANEYSVYEEADADESVLLRQVRGGHKQEITIMAIDFHLSLIATGCINGEITLYDFEMSKNVGILIGHKENITALKFIPPYPILVSASLDQTVCIWGVRGSQHSNKCLKSIQNTSWNFCKDLPCAVLSILGVFKENSKGIKKYTRLRSHQDEIPPKIRGSEISEFLSNITAPCDDVCMAMAFRNFEQNFVFSLMPVNKMYEEDYPPDNEFQRKRYKKFSLKKMHQKVLNKKTYQRVLQEENQRQQRTFDLHTKVEGIQPKVFRSQSQRQQIQGGSNLFGYNEHIDEEKDRMYIYIGDEIGYLKIWCIDHIIEEFGIEKVDRYVDIIKREYNPYRKEQVDCSDYVDTLREEYSQSKIPEPVNANLTGMLIREIKGHHQAINNLDMIDLTDLNGFISCSKDRKIISWTLELDVMGKLNLDADEKDDPRWTFPSEVRTIMEIEEVEKLRENVQQLNLGLDGKRKRLIAPSSEEGKHMLAHHGHHKAHQSKSKKSQDTGPKETWKDKNAREKKKIQREQALKKLNQKIKQRHEYKMQQVSSNIEKQLQNHENTNKLALEAINFDKQGFSLDLNNIIDQNIQDLKITQATEPKPTITTESAATPSKPKEKAGKMKLLKVKPSGVVDMTNILGKDASSEEQKKENYQAVTPGQVSSKPLIIVGPSGVGKHTLIQELIKRYPDEFKRAPSYVCYHPLNEKRPLKSKHLEISRKQFDEKVSKKDFIQYREINGPMGHQYGTCRLIIQEICLEMMVPIIEVDVAGAFNLHKAGLEGSYLFIYPPSSQELLKRIKNRGLPEVAEKKRFEHAIKEIDMADQSGIFDLRLKNDNLDRAQEKLQQIAQKLISMDRELTFPSKSGGLGLQKKQSIRSTNKVLMFSQEISQAALASPTLVRNSSTGSAQAQAAAQRVFESQLATPHQMEPNAASPDGKQSDIRPQRIFKYTKAKTPKKKFYKAKKIYGFSNLDDSHSSHSEHSDHAHHIPSNLQKQTCSLPQFKILKQNHAIYSAHEKQAQEKQEKKHSAKKAPNVHGHGHGHGAPHAPQKPPTGHGHGHGHGAPQETQSTFKLSDNTAKDSTFTTTKQSQFLTDKNKHSTQTSFMQAISQKSKQDLKYNKEQYICKLKHPLIHLNRFHPLSSPKKSGKKVPKWISKCSQCHTNIKNDEWYHRCNQCQEDYCAKCMAENQEDAIDENQKLVINGQQRFHDSKNDKLLFVNEKSMIPKLRTSLSSVIIGKQIDQPQKKDRIKDMVATQEKQEDAQITQKKRAKKPPKIPDIRQQLNIYLNMDPYFHQYKTHTSSTPDHTSLTKTLDQKPRVFLNTDSSSNFASTINLEARMPHIVNLHTQSSSVTTLPSVAKTTQQSILIDVENDLELRKQSSRSIMIKKQESTFNRSTSLLQNKSVRCRTPQDAKPRERKNFYGKGSLLEKEMKALKVKLKHEKEILLHKKELLNHLKRSSQH